MPQTATIKSLPAAFEMMKAMQVEWGEDYREATRQALARLLEGRMDQLIDEQLERMAELGQADRRNGCYRRHLLTELGAIELAVPRTRTFSAFKVVRAYARRAKDVDRMILACFLLGLSTRKVAVALLPVLGRPVSPVLRRGVLDEGASGRVRPCSGRRGREPPRARRGRGQGLAGAVDDAQRAVHQDQSRAEWRPKRSTAGPASSRSKVERAPAAGGPRPERRWRRRSRASAARGVVM